MKRTTHPVPVCLAALVSLGAVPARAAEPSPPKPAASLPSAKPAPELFLAVGQGNVAAVKELLARGADPNARNTIQMTALMVAVGTGNLQVIEALLAGGADVNATSM